MLTRGRGSTGEDSIGCPWSPSYLDSDEFVHLSRSLGRQTLQDSEFVGAIGGIVPETCNRLIAPDGSEILVFIKTDGRSVDEHRLEQ